MLTAADRISSSYPEPSCMNAWDEARFLRSLGGIGGKWGFFLGTTSRSYTTHFSPYPLQLFTHPLDNTSSQLNLLATSAGDTRALSDMAATSLYFPYGPSAVAGFEVRYFIKVHSVGPKKCCLDHNWNFDWPRNRPWQCWGIPREERLSKS